MVLKRSSKSQTTTPLKEIFKRCSSLGTKGGKEGQPEDVPKGHFAVYIGENKRRYIIPISWLSQPEFKCLLQLAEEEFGFRHQMGIINIPCDEIVFQSLAASIRLRRSQDCMRLF